jgi:hypothetical protein
MTLKEFIETHEVDGFEILPDTLIMSVVSDEISYGLEVDTSNVVCGLPLTLITEYFIEDDILTVEGLILDTTSTNLI